MWDMINLLNNYRNSYINLTLNDLNYKKSLQNTLITQISFNNYNNPLVNVIDGYNSQWFPINYDLLFYTQNITYTAVIYPNGTWKMEKSWRMEYCQFWNELGFADYGWAN